MATEPRLESLLDDPMSLVRRGSIQSCLQLPPLQDALAAHLSTRPLPLEPNTIANEETHAKSSALSSSHAVSDKRSQCEISNRRGPEQHPYQDKRARGNTACSNATSALPMIAKAPTSNSPFAEVGSVNRSSNLTPASTPRKRQKLGPANSSSDGFVHLPKPAQRKSKPAQLPKLPALNVPKSRLKNAARFPPIAPLGSDSEHEESRRASAAVRTNAMQDDLAISDLLCKQRQAIKTRKKWSKQETENLLQGVALYGIGHWKKILEDTKFKFNDRSSIDLKDRFRTCCPDEYLKHLRSKPSKAVQVSCDIEPCTSTPTTVPQSTTSQCFGTPASAPHSCPTREPQRDSSKPPSKSRSHRLKPEDLARIGIQGPFLKAKRRERRAFTDDEDAHLLQGYMMYGPHWTRIQEDSSLDLRSRRATDLRDRFRNRYPERYAEAGFKFRPKPGTKHVLGKGSTATSIANAEMAHPPNKRHREPEPFPEAGSLLEDEAPVSTAESPIDWGDNTLAPFTTQSGNSTSDSTSSIHPLLLDHIQPLLTYDPARSPNSAHFSKQKKDATSTSGVDLASLTTKPIHTTHSPIGLKPATTAAASTATATAIATATATASQQPPFNLPPPTDLLPLDFEPFSSSLSSSSSSSSAPHSHGPPPAPSVAPSSIFSLPTFGAKPTEIISKRPSHGNGDSFLSISGLLGSCTCSCSGSGSGGSGGGGGGVSNSSSGSSTNDRIGTRKGSNGAGGGGGGGGDDGGGHRGLHATAPPSSSSKSNGAGGAPLAGSSIIGQGALLWENMATHPMFDIDADGSMEGP